MKNTHKTGLAAVAMLLCAATLAPAQDGVLAIRGGAIHTISHGVIDNGVILVRDGKILDVGRDIAIPDGAEVIDATGLVVTPGIIDSRTYYGLDSDARWDQENLLATARRIVDAFEPPEENRWLMGGVTAVYMSPGPQNLLGGYGVVMKLAGDGPEAVVKDMAAMSASFGESALDEFGLQEPGEEAREVSERRTTRQGLIGRLRVELIRAQEYLEGTQPSAEGEAGAAALEALAPVLRGELPFRVVANTPDDISTALRIAEEFDLKLIIDVGAGAHMVADRLAEAGVPVVVGPSIMGLGGGGPFEMFAQTPKNAGRLHRAGVKIALSTDASRGRSVVLEAVVAKAHGLPEDATLRAVTLDAAEILGVADRLGSIEPGKDADLVIWDGCPVGTWGESRRVIVNGRTVFER
ncbi:MAG: amidohydrolase family protein [Gemmatimonadota bacterium]|nr:MAG: amidohydrolase family protein [Gemmatimonadota bacterium]